MKTEYEKRLRVGRKLATKILKKARREYKRHGMSYTWEWNGSGTICTAYLNGKAEDQIDIEPIIDGEGHDETGARIASRDIPNSTGEA